MAFQSMQLKVHVGTERTGSSFLQSVLYRFRNELESMSVLFPRGLANDERAMNQQEISAGNGRRLANALSKDHWAEVGRIVGTYCLEAQRKNCSTVVVSCEQLLVVLGNVARMQHFTRMVKETGFEKIEFLIVLRDPGEQAVSLYRHRAKNGRIGSPDKWFSSKFKTAEDADAFRESAILNQNGLTFIGYIKDANELRRRILDQWLGMNIDGEIPSTPVNESLRVSELQLINLCGRVDRLSPRFMWPEFRRLRLEDRVEDTAWLEYLNYLARLSIRQRKEIWTRLNALLPNNHRFELDEDQLEVVERPNGVSCSEQQFAVALKVMTESRTLRWRCRSVWAFRVKPCLSRVKWASIRSGIYVKESFAVSKMVRRHD
jgi:hypothetical protein